MSDDMQEPDPAQIYLYKRQRRKLCFYYVVSFLLLKQVEDEVLRALGWPDQLLYSFTVFSGLLAIGALGFYIMNKVFPSAPCSVHDTSTWWVPWVAPVCDDCRKVGRRHAPWMRF